jgi:Dynamin central region
MHASVKVRPVPLLGVCGCRWQAALARALNAILVTHIRAQLPSLGRDLEEAAEARARELRTYGDTPPGNSSAAR